ncbi:MAG: class I SAM-dependent methyltransferase [Candidatus Hodarchaeota archaeon]
MPSFKEVIIQANSVRRYLGYPQSSNLKKYSTKNPFAYRQIERFVLAILKEINDKNPNPQKILDIGCGEGLIPTYGGLDFTGLDLSPSALQIANKINKRSHFLCGSGDHLPFGSTSFDLILCLEVMEHVPTPDLLLQELDRVLTPEGVALVTVPYSRIYRTLNLIRFKNVRRLGEDKDHTFRFNPRLFRKILSHHFTSVQIKHTIPWLIGIGSKC